MSASGANPTTSNPRPLPAPGELERIYKTPTTRRTLTPMQTCFARIDGYLGPHRNIEALWHLIYRAQAYDSAYTLNDLMVLTTFVKYRLESYHDYVKNQILLCLLQRIAVRQWMLCDHDAPAAAESRATLVARKMWNRVLPLELHLAARSAGDDNLEVQTGIQRARDVHRYDLGMPPTLEEWDRDLLRREDQEEFGMILTDFDAAVVAGGEAQRQRFRYREMQEMLLLQRQRNEVRNRQLLALARESDQQAQ
ncbi:hypothetical protein FN846DRAFT_906864 [Sphaerosporella brunnea]|uniref:Uncharacterized protein n=1 Tax=Sphaerosporella brunnea TaxID=1250544 RepID=A0A5J5EXY2_9PEZI|nr:hypothetical protein FN846DRAFT_906864 [Sphaerosporella brunnea]